MMIEITALFSSVISFTNMEHFLKVLIIIMVFNAPETIHPKLKDISLDKKGYHNPVIVIYHLNM